MHLRQSVMSAALVVAGGFGIHAAAAQTAAPGGALANIGHIVVIFEENRSFDNMFGMFPGATGWMWHAIPLRRSIATASLTSTCRQS